MRRGERGVAAHVDFRGRGEPAQGPVGVPAGRQRAGERGFGQVDLGGDLLEPGVRGEFPVEEQDPGGVAAEGAVGEGIDDSQAHGATVGPVPDRRQRPIRDDWPRLSRSGHRRRPSPCRPPTARLALPAARATGRAAGRGGGGRPRRFRILGTARPRSSSPSARCTAERSAPGAPAATASCRSSRSRTAGSRTGATASTPSRCAKPSAGPSTTRRRGTE